MSTAGQPSVKPPSVAAPATTQPTRPPIALSPEQAARAKLRRSIYALLIAISVGSTTGRILAVNAVDQIGAEKVFQQVGREDWQRQRPFLSGNDRSRWLTARALVEKGTFAIEQYVTDPKTYPNWDSIDIVMHRDSAGTPHIYSSKPPLLTTLYAVPYWAVYKISTAIRGTPITLGTHPYEIGRGIILLVNVLPLVIYFFVLAGILERYGQSDWGRIFVMAAATLGTFLTTFAVAINNHLPAAVCVAITLSAALRIWYDGDRRWHVFAMCGFFAAFAAACELPALSFFALIAAITLWRAPRQTLMAFVPAALLVVIAFFAANWFAHHNLIPPYAHREHKPITAANSDATVITNNGSDANASSPGNTDYYQSTLTLDSGQTVTLRGNGNDWYDYEFTRTDGGVTKSYWLNPKGIDVGEASIGKYAQNLLVGHHGIFSLSPIWLLVLPGLVLSWWGKDYRLREFAAVVAVISVVVITFYTLRPQSERNYGGTTSAFRWVFWLAPLWLLSLLPTADWLARRSWSRLFGCILLAISVLSATYPVWNPWTHPWLWNLTNWIWPN